MKLKCGKNKPLISRKELSIRQNSVVLEDLTRSTDKDVVDLLFYSPCNSVSSPVV